MAKGYVPPSIMLRSILGENTTRDSLQQMIDGRGTHPLRVALAREVLAATAERQRYAIDRSGTAYAAGLDAEPGRALARIMDRLEGTPLRRLEIERTERPRTAADVVADIGRLLQRVPALAAVVRLRQAYAAPPGADADPPGDPGDTTDDSSVAAKDRPTTDSQGGGHPQTAATPVPGTLLTQNVEDGISQVPAELTDAQAAVLNAGSGAWHLTERNPVGSTSIESEQGVSDADVGDRGSGAEGCSGVRGEPERDAGDVVGGRDAVEAEAGGMSGDEQQPGSGDSDDFVGPEGGASVGGGSGREGCRVIPGTSADGADPDEGELDIELGSDYPSEDE